MPSSSLNKQSPQALPEHAPPRIGRVRRMLAEWLRMGVIAAVIGTLYAWRGGAALFYLLLAAGFLMLGGLLVQLFGPRNVQITRRLSPPKPLAGDSVHVEVELAFASPLPLPWMIVADDWGGICHRELLFPGFRRKLKYDYLLKKTARGVHRLRVCGISWGDIPGLFTGSLQHSGEASFKVLPKPLYMGGPLPVGGALTGGVLPHNRENGSGDPAETRDYAPGDPLNRIHWKNSARKGTLQSRVQEKERGKMTSIVLANDPDSYAAPVSALLPRSRRSGSTPAFERAVSAAMGLLLSAERSGAYVQLFTGGWPEGHARHEGVGKLPVRVQDLLAEITPGGERPLEQLLADASAAWLPGMSVAVITGRLEEAAARKLAQFMLHGVKVELYYVWDQPSPGRGHDTISASLARLGAKLYCLDPAPGGMGRRGEDRHESAETPKVR